MTKIFAVAALAVTLSACNCGRPVSDLIIPGPDGGTPDGGEPPRGTMFHAALTFQLTYAKPPFILPRPDAIDGVLTVQQSGSDVHGAIALLGDTSSTSLIAVKGTLTGTALTLEPGEAWVKPYGSLGWKTMQLELVANGTGTSAGTWNSYGGDVVDTADYTATISVAKDVSGEQAFVEPMLVDTYRDQFLPIDGVRVRVREPVAEPLARGDLKVRAGGQTVSAAPATQPIEGLVTTVELTPDAWLPFDQEISIDVGALTDPAGNAIVADTKSHRTVADPGSMLANLDFELGLTGWAIVGRKVGPVEGAYNGLQPAAGTHQMVVREDSATAGYFDVPATATKLSFSAALFSEAAMFDANRTATVKVYVQGQTPIVVLDGHDLAMKSVTCSGSCSEFGTMVPAERYAVDLTPLRGKRLFLVAEVRSSYFFGVTQFAMALDDFRLE